MPCPAAVTKAVLPIRRGSRVKSGSSSLRFLGAEYRTERRCRTKTKGRVQVSELPSEQGQGYDLCIHKWGLI